MRKYMTLEEIQDEANNLSVAELWELSGFCESLANAIEEENA